MKIVISPGAGVAGGPVYFAGYLNVGAFMLSLHRIYPGSLLFRGLAGLVLLVQASVLWAQTPVTLQLKWSHGFQFAGYYAAQEKGYYRAAGLDVRVIEATPKTDVPEEVLAGRADFGVGTSSLLLARKAGQPVVVLAAIFQHSPIVLLTRRDSVVRSLPDLVGKNVMIERGSDELLAYLRREHVPVDGLNQVEHSFDINDLAEGRVDAMSAYSSVEPYHLERVGVAYRMFTPRSGGVDFYGDNLFTTENQLRQRPELVRAFREASLKGWRYAMDHPEEVAALIQTRYAPDQSLDFLLFEAREMISLVQPDLVEIGYMSPARWQQIADVYGDMGMLPRQFDFTGFLFADDGKADLEGLRIYLGAALAAIVLVAGVAAYIHRINRRLLVSVAESRRAAEDLHASERKYRLLTESMKDVAWIADADSLRFTYVSPSIEWQRGYTPSELVGTAIDLTVQPQERAALRNLVRQRARAFRADPDNQQFYTDIFEQPCKDGATVWTEVVSTYSVNLRSGGLELQGVTRDITERRATQERIAYLAEHDTLTGLPNRALVTDRLSQALASARREGHGVALLYIDLDRFKPVNDTHGHAVGDLLLREAAQRMRDCVRESDTVGRFGGDEFVVLLPRVEVSDDALRVAEKIRSALASPFLVSGLRLEVSSSIGVALYPEDGRSESSLLLGADRAMYEAKRSGRDQVSLYRR